MSFKRISHIFNASEKYKRICYLRCYLVLLDLLRFFIEQALGAVAYMSPVSHSSPRLTEMKSASIMTKIAHSEINKQIIHTANLTKYM